MKRGREVPRDELLAAARHWPRIDAARFRADIDEFVDQSIEPQRGSAPLDRTQRADRNPDALGQLSL